MPATSTGRAQCRDQRFPDRMELVIAGELLRFDHAVFDLEGDVIDNQVEKALRGEHAADQYLKLRAALVLQRLSIDRAPRAEAVEPGRQRADVRLDTVADHQYLVDAQQLRHLRLV